MANVYNPSAATIADANADRDDVASFHLFVYLDGHSITDRVFPKPAANPDGTYTLDLAPLTDAIYSTYYGRTDFELRATSVNSNGESVAAVAPDQFTWQPTPAAPESVSLS